MPRAFHQIAAVVGTVDADRVNRIVADINRVTAEIADALAAREGIDGRSSVPFSANIDMGQRNICNLAASSGEGDAVPRSELREKALYASEDRHDTTLPIYARGGLRVSPIPGLQPEDIVVQSQLSDVSGSIPGTLDDLITPTAGDLIYANVTPTWTVLPIGAAGACLQPVGGFPAWSTNALDAVARTTVRKNSGADVGSRRRLNLIEGANITLTVADDAGDEEVDITVASAVGSHALLSATHTDVVPVTPPTQGDLIVANSGPLWTVLGIGGAATFLRSDGTDPSWQALSDADVGAVNHSALAGLAADDHTQYALLAGRATGQTLIGGTAAGEDLTLQSTANAARGHIFFGSAATSGYDEVNARLGLGTVSPATQFHVVGPSGQIATALTNVQAVVENQAIGATVARLAILGGTSGEAGLTLGDFTGFNQGGISYDLAGDFLALRGNNAERLRILSTGDVIVNAGGSTGSPALLWVRETGATFTPTLGVQIACTDDVGGGDAGILLRSGNAAKCRLIAGDNARPEQAYIEWDNTAGFWRFFGEFAGAPTEGVTINFATGADKRVGINNTSPVASLHVGASGSNGDAIIESELSGGTATTSDLDILHQNALLPYPGQWYDQTGRINIHSFVELLPNNWTQTTSAAAPAVRPLINFSPTITVTGEILHLYPGFLYGATFRYNTAGTFLNTNPTFWAQPVFQPTAAITDLNNLFGFDAQPYFHPDGVTATADQFGGFWARPQLRRTGAGVGNVDEMWGYKSYAYNAIFSQDLASAGTVNHLYHFWGGSPTIAGGATAVTVTEEVGVQIDALTAGTTVISLRSLGSGVTMRHVGDVRIGDANAPVTTLDVRGGASFGVRSVASANATLLANDFLLLHSTGASNRTATLPTAANTGQIVHIIKTDAGAGNVVITRAGADTIEGATTLSLVGQYASAMLIASGGTVWYRMDQ